MMIKYLFSILCCFLCLNLTAQESIAQVEFEVLESSASFLGKTIEVRDILELQGDLSIKKRSFKKDRKRPENFKNRRGFSKSVIAELEHQGPDPIRQMSSAGLAIEPKVNVIGLGDFGSPHDPTGDIGLDYYIQGVNVTDIGIFDKTGNLVLEFEAQDLWATLGANSAGDPIILFDEIAQRWFITEFTGPANLLIAVSETSDPMGSYFAYSFSTPNFPDYPKYAIWPEALVVTTNEQGAGTLHHYFIDRMALLAGEANVTMQRVGVTGNTNTEAGFYVATPVDVDGPSFPDDIRPISMVINDSSWGSTAQDQLEMYRFDIDWVNPNNTQVDQLSLPTTPFDSYPCAAPGFGFACIPQMGGGGIDGIPEVIMNVPKMRRFDNHESLVLSFVTDATDGDDLAAIRWMELRREDADWFIYQEGTYAPDDGLHRFMSSIAIDGSGNIGLGYNVSSPNDFVGVRFTGRFSTDPLGEMTIEEYNAVDGQNAIQSGGRFGDYSQMSVDPVDESTFWFTTEYAGVGNSGVRTRIVAFELRRDSIDAAMTSIDSPVSFSSAFTANEDVSITVTNAGNFPIADYTLAYSLDGSELDATTITDSLYPGDSYNHTFDNPADLSNKGAYALETYVSHPDDSRLSNDTLTMEVLNLFDRNAAITVGGAEEVCTSVALVNVTIQNTGGEVMTNSLVEYLVNGVVEGNESWSGNLDYLETASFDINVPLSQIGNNEIEVRIIEVNGDTDQDNTNDSAIANVDYLEGYSSFTLELTTDEYPGETTWRVTTQSGALIVTGGPYEDAETEYVERFCLEDDVCYTFIIFDTAGDGICCGFGQGSYSLFNQNGENVFVGDGDFGFQDLTDFCNDECNLDGNVSISDSNGANNGTIMIDVNGGDGNYEYSIDGGDNFQSSNLFENLSPGEYDIVVRSNNGECEWTITVEVEGISSTNQVINNNVIIQVTPNPNNGIFNLTVSNLIDAENLLAVEILNAQGKRIQSRKISKYNEEYVGQFSLVDYPSGIYFVKVVDSRVNKVVRISKI